MTPADRPATEPHPMEQYLAEQAAKPGPTMTITKAAYVFLLEQLRAAEAAQGAALRAEEGGAERRPAPTTASPEHGQRPLAAPRAEGLPSADWEFERGRRLEQHIKLGCRECVVAAWVDDAARADRRNVRIRGTNRGVVRCLRLCPR